jgi:hypothetical protein
MIKNQNIFISVQIEKNLETKALVLNIHFDTNAPNFFIENKVMHWNPTSDEIGFVSEVVDLLNHHEYQHTNDAEVTPRVPSDERTKPPETYTQSDSAMDEAIDPEVIPHLAKSEADERIFIQADEKKIDEIIKRKKSGFSEEFVIESNDKSKLDRMLKQKKKKV